MRYEPSQSTPSFFIRRWQLKVLSLVGLIAFAIIAFSVTNGLPTTERLKSPFQRTNSTESLAYEANREPRALDSEEEVVLTGFEDEPPRAELASNDHGLFKPRSQERTEDGGLFPRRTKSPAVRDDATLTDDSALDDDIQPERTVPAARAKIGDARISIPRSRMPSSVSSSSFDDDGESDSLRGNRVDAVSQEELPRGNPLSSDREPLASDGSSDPFDDSAKPFRPNGPSTRRGRTTGPIDDGSADDSLTDASNFGKRPIRSNGFDEDTSVDDVPATDPLDLDRGRRRGRWTSDPTDAEPFREDSLPVRIKDKRFLDQVRDNDVGIRRDEADAYYWLLDYAQRVSLAMLEQAGLREIQYVNLMTEPDRFRGEPITIEGDLWQLEEYDAGRNDYDVSRLYVGWVFTSDSGNHPYRIVCTKLGKGIEPGVNLRKPVRITGYFFKREGYESNGGIRFAPTLLARRIAVNPLPNGIPLLSGILPHMLGALMAIGLALLVTVVAFAIGDERTMQAGMKRLHRHPQVSFAGLGIPGAVSVEESLREFAERERQSAISGAYGPLLSRQTAREHAVQDYSTSRQGLVNEGQIQHQRQTNVLQDWTTRQKESQAEIDALRTGKLSRPTESQSFDDELNSDKLDPARHLLSRQKHETKPGANHLGLSPLELAAAAQIESDRLARERQIREQLHRDKADIERKRLQEVAQDLAHQERLEQEQQRHEQHERDRIAHERHAFERSHPTTLNHGSAATPITVSEKLELERLEREREEHDRHERQRLEFERHEHERREREQRDHERIEFERHERERHDRERLERERSERERSERERIEHEQTQAHREFTRHEDPVVEYSPEYSEDQPLDEPGTTETEHESHSSGHRNGGWEWPQRRKHDPTNETSSSDISPTDEREVNQPEGVRHPRSGKRRSNWGFSKRRKNTETTDDIGETDEP